MVTFVNLKGTGNSPSLTFAGLKVIAKISQKCSSEETPSINCLHIVFSPVLFVVTIAISLVKLWIDIISYNKIYNDELWSFLLYMDYRTAEINVTINSQSVHVANK